jgi:two-component system chemotaxis sensor kinase CheA
MARISDEIVERFRSASSDRLRRIEAAWNRSLLEQGGTVSEMMRELHTLKGDAAIVGESSVHRLCQKLEDLVQRIEQQRPNVPTDEIELVVTMAIQFVGMILRAKQHAMAGLDLAGFMRQIDDVLHDTAPGVNAEPAAHARQARATAPQRIERLARDTRDRLAIAATAIYLEALAARDDNSRRRLHTAWRSLQRELARLDATEITSVIERHATAGRELAHALDKHIEITVHCVDARVSPQVAEVIDVALLHIVRNAVDHGIELPAERTRKSKPAHGTIRIRATMRENDLEIVVEDDGAGIDVAAVSAVAASRGIRIPERPIDVVFEPRLSTRSQVTSTSGRGVGLDAVKSELARVGGHISVESAATGTSVRFLVPARLRKSEVLHFTVPGATLPFAISSRWKVGLGGRRPKTIDPLAALGIGKVREQSDSSVLRMRWGFHELAMPITAAPVLATAELVCPTPDDQPVEIVLVNGCEALLVRPEYLT